MKVIQACEVDAAPHNWRAIYGGPFGWTEMDKNGCIQECSACGHRRRASWMEAAMSRTIQDLRQANSHTPRTYPVKTPTNSGN